MNAADPVQVKARETAAKRAARLAIEDLEAIMSTPQGRRFMGRLLGLAPMSTISYRSGESPTDTAFREGRRSVCVDVMTEIVTHCAPAYGLMITEQNEGPK